MRTTRSETESPESQGGAGETAVAAIDGESVENLRVEIESATWLFEQMGLERDERSDHSHIRRLFEEAIGAWPGGVRERWWRWIVEASHGLGLRCRVVDCVFAQLIEVVREGGRVVVRVEGIASPWIAITASTRSGFEVLRPLTDDAQTSLSSDALRHQLCLNHPTDVVRCVVIEPLVAGEFSNTDDSLDATLSNRLWQLIRPETGDVWIVVLFGFISGLLTMATPLAVEALVNTVAFGQLLQPVIVLAIMLLTVLSFSAALKGLQTFVVEIIQRRLFARVVADLAYRLPRAQYEAFEGHSGRELVNRFFDVATVQKIVAQLLLDGVGIVLSSAIGMAVLAFYHPWLLGFDIVLLALIAFIVLGLGQGAVATSVKESKLKYYTAAWLQDLAGCPTTFRYDGAAEFALERADHLTYDYIMARKKHFRILMRQILFAYGLQAAAGTALLGLGGWLVISGQLTLGQLVAAELIVTIVVGSFAKLGKHMESFYDLMASIDKLGTLFDLPIESQQGLLRFPHQRPANVRVCDVSHTLPDGRVGLEGLNLRVESGEHVLLTGPSGAGKSVLLDLLFGLRHPSHGHVEISGADPREMRPDVLRRHVALARENEPFAGTIAENVHLERPDISTSDVREALARVGLLDHILHLPESLETHLNSVGHPLSSNQLRRLMIARAIVGRPSLLLIDGTLDALPDAEIDTLVSDLTDASQPWTLMLVSGRETLVSKFVRRVRLDPVSQGSAHSGGHSHGNHTSGVSAHAH